MACSVEDGAKTGVPVVPITVPCSMSTRAISPPAWIPPATGWTPRASNPEQSSLRVFKRHGAVRVEGAGELHLHDGEQPLALVLADLEHAPEVRAGRRRGDREQVLAVQHDREALGERHGLVDGDVQAGRAEDLGDPLVLLGVGAARRASLSRW